MKSQVATFARSARRAWAQAASFALIAPALLLSASHAHADAIDLTTDTSGGKKFSDVADNLAAASKSGAGLIVQVVTVVGFAVVALSLWQFYKSSKDERETPTSAIVGLFAGGAMAGVGTIMWIMKSTVTG